jgi:hypothetical protein
MPRRLVLTLIALGLTVALSAAPVAAGGGSLAIGNAGADGEVGGGFSSDDDGVTWTSSILGCATGGPFLGADELRFAVEFPLSGLPANASITGATLSVRNSFGAFSHQTALYGYPGDGSITAADVQVGGTPILFTPATATREDHDVTTLMTAGMVSVGWAGFSFRQDPLGTAGPEFWDCPNNAAYPILTIAYDLPNPPTPVASGLPNAAMDGSADTSPLLALGFALLLLGSLGTLAFANTRRQ